MLNVKEISVVIQGPVFPAGGKNGEGSTARAIESTRRVLPGAEVILSTWEGADTSGLKPDQLICSPDPGGNSRIDDGKLWSFGNITRQMVSTRAGLEAATRPYAVKLRADAELRSDAFLHLGAKYPARSEKLRLFAERLVIPSYISWSPDRPETRLFHLSDLFFFGATEDLRKLFSIPLPPLRCIPEEYGADDPNRSLSEVLTNCTMEQYLHSVLVRAHQPISLHSTNETTPELRALHDLYVANNFVIGEFHQIGLHVAKFAETSRLLLLDHYTHGEWQRLYRKYCDPHFSPGFDWTAFKNRTAPWVIPPARSLLRLAARLSRPLRPQRRG